MTITAKQQKVLDRINDHADYVVKDFEDCGSFLSITFRNNETHALLQEDYHIFVQPRGKVVWVSAYRLLSDRPARRVMCSLANYDLMISNRRKLVFGDSLKGKEKH